MANQKELMLVMLSAMTSNGALDWYYYKKKEEEKRAAVKEFILDMNSVLSRNNERDKNIPDSNTEYYQALLSNVNPEMYDAFKQLLNEIFPEEELKDQIEHNSFVDESLAVSPVISIDMGLNEPMERNIRKELDATPPDPPLDIEEEVTEPLQIEPENEMASEILNEEQNIPENDLLFTDSKEPEKEEPGPEVIQEPERPVYEENVPNVEEIRNFMTQMKQRGDKRVAPNNDLFSGIPRREVNPPGVQNQNLTQREVFNPFKEQQQKVEAVNEAPIFEQKVNAETAKPEVGADLFGGVKPAGDLFNNLTEPFVQPQSQPIQPEPKPFDGGIDLFASPKKANADLFGGMQEHPGNDVNLFGAVDVPKAPEPAKAPDLFSGNVMQSQPDQIFNKPQAQPDLFANDLFSNNQPKFNGQNNDLFGNSGVQKEATQNQDFDLFSVNQAKSGKKSDENLEDLLNGNAESQLTNFINF